MPGPALNPSILPSFAGSRCFTHAFAKCRVNAFGEDFEAMMYLGWVLDVCHVFLPFINIPFTCAGGCNVFP